VAALRRDALTDNQRFSMTLLAAPRRCALAISVLLRVDVHGVHADDTRLPVHPKSEEEALSVMGVVARPCIKIVWKFKNTRRENYRYLNSSTTLL